jgi:signal transduction histidine kinase
MMGPGGMMGQGMMGSMGSVEALPDVYIIVGLDVSDHLAVYRNFRRNAMFHTAYVLTAAMLVWFLAVGFMRRRTLAGRAASLERFQSRLLDNLPDGLVTVDGRGVIRAANPAAHVILDAEPGELAGRSCTSIGPEAAACLRASRDGASTWRHHEIGGRSLEILALPLPDETSGLGRMVLLRDRTRLRSMERSLGEAQRLAAIGRLAAGVAHEIRNPLSALRGFAQLFAKKFSPGQPEKEYADTMVREADRLNRVITDLLFLSKPRSVEPVDVDLEELAAELSRLLEMDLSAKGVTLRTELAAPTVHADRDMLKQALLNLVLNSMEAMEEAMEEARADAHDDAGIRAPGGAVVLRSRAVVPADAAAYRGRGGADGDGGPAVGPGAVEVCVQDDGPGMDPGLADSAFEPFYTAKRTGTGLGLAFVRKTARDHGGEAVIRSEPGRGCAVCMLFPGPEATAASADAAPAGAGTTVADGTTVVGAADAPRGPAAARSGAAIPLPDGPITPPGPSKAGGPTESTGEHSPRGGRR